MAVELNCSACEEIRQEVPELIANGFDDAMCASLKNDTGLKASSGHNDCTDLDNLTDCLIGNMDTEIDDYDSCSWKDFMKKYIPNTWTVLKSITCAICGLWTNIHSLWATIRSLCINVTGHTLKLTSNLGTHCSVTLPDENTTYDLTKSGNQIKLTGSDGSVDIVSDDNTTYDLTKSGNQISLTGSDGSVDVVLDDNTTYTLSLSGNNLTLTPSSGSAQTVVLPGGNNTTYTISINDHTITLTGSDGSTVAVTVPDNDTRYQFHTKTYTQANVVVVAGDTAVIDVLAPQPSEYTDTLFPMAVAGWTWEGTFASYLVTRYIQLVDRSGSPKVRVAVRNIATPASDGSHDANVTLSVEVFWQGLLTT